MLNTPAEHRRYTTFPADRREGTYAVRASIFAGSAEEAEAALAYYEAHNTPSHQTVDARIERAREMVRLFDAEARHHIITVRKVA